MKKLHFITIVLALSGLGASALAADAMSDAMNDFNMNAKACKSDLNQYCKDVTPGQGRIAACIRAHDDKLSASCKTEWQNYRAELRQKIKSEIQVAQKACGGDVQKFCQNALGASEVSSCLNDHAANLSSSCKNYQASVKERAGTAASK